MRAVDRSPPTRSGLRRLERRLDRVRRGASLLRRKREALVVELFRRGRPAVNAREVIEEIAARAYPSLHDALAVHGQTGVNVLGWPVREVAVEVDLQRVWGIAAPVVVGPLAVRRTLPARGTAPETTGPSGVAAASQFEDLIERLIEAAPREQTIRRLAHALADATRQVNTLERRVATALQDGATRIRRALDDREREEQTRLRHLLRVRRRTEDRA